MPIGIIYQQNKPIIYLSSTAFATCRETVRKPRRSKFDPYYPGRYYFVIFRLVQTNSEFVQDGTAREELEFLAHLDIGALANQS